MVVRVKISALKRSSARVRHAFCPRRAGNSCSTSGGRLADYSWRFPRSSAQPPLSLKSTSEKGSRKRDCEAKSAGSRPRRLTQPGRASAASHWAYSGGHFGSGSCYGSRLSRFGNDCLARHGDPAMAPAAHDSGLRNLRRGTAIPIPSLVCRI
jgi:hypothetical protein